MLTILLVLSLYPIVCTLGLCIIYRFRFLKLEELLFLYCDLKDPEIFFEGANMRLPAKDPLRIYNIQKQNILSSPFIKYTIHTHFGDMLVRRFSTGSRLIDLVYKEWYDFKKSINKKSKTR